ncbi:hypothetical protein LTR54_013978 [Friedmanniomyces endolithicus]|nr:hypothetical protein LTS00_007795 [Friedmanniomyces endolithicus]KAK0984858.1 hypothetical protein LTR54_013978 [Friedmanniomyces endolithicus]
MRLLRRYEDGSISLTRDITNNDEIPPNAILSHTWAVDSDHEATYQDVVRGDGVQKAGYEKIRFCSTQAYKDGLDYFWVDTCCIDRSSSSELSEAINSMLDATVDDVHHLSFTRQWETDFRESRWFRRGWTLQELLAPESVDFYSTEGTKLSDKCSLRQQIREITGIPDSALRNEPLADFAIGERLSWALDRQTTRVEDKAYSLLGIFDASLPILYGEGTFAFARLLESVQAAGLQQRHLLSGQDQLLHTLPKSSSAAFNSTETQYAATCMPATRVELLSEIYSWAEGAHGRNIFWLNGMAGTGKSTIARTLARRSHEQGTLGGSFFFSRRHDKASCADKLFTTLAFQLALSVPKMKRHICDALSTRKDIGQSSLHEQWNDLIVKPMSKLKSHKPRYWIVVLDGLDECDNQRDLSTVLRLLASPEVSANTRLRFFVTSRPVWRIRQEIHTIPEAQRQCFVLHDMAPSLVDRDLSIYVETQLASRERDRVASWHDAQLVARLVKMANGCFLQASLACRYILEEGPLLAERRVRTILQTGLLGASLDVSYTLILRNFMAPDKDGGDRPERRRKLLGTLAVLLQPLSIKSLAVLLQTESQAVADTLADLNAVVNIPSGHDQPIMFFHNSFREFLVSGSRCVDTDFGLDEQDAHMVLAGSCVRLLSKVLYRNTDEQSAPGALHLKPIHSRPKQRLTPESQYACLYWVQHLRLSGACIRESDDASHLLKTWRTQWIEAIRLLQEPSAAKRTFQKCSLLLPPDSRTSFELSVASPSGVIAGAEATYGNRQDDPRPIIELEGPEASGTNHVFDVSPCTSRDEKHRSVGGPLTPGKAHEDDESDTHDLDGGATLDDDAVSCPDEATDSNPTSVCNSDSTECLSPSVASDNRNILPFRFHRGQAVETHTTGTDGTTGTSEIKDGSTRSGVSSVGNNHSSSNGDSHKGTRDFNQEGDGNEDRAPDLGSIRELTSENQASQMPCPCVSPDDGLCQGSEPNISNMRCETIEIMTALCVHSLILCSWRKLRSCHQFFDCERCWDASDNKGAYDSHDCLRCEPCCISGACEHSGETIASRKHPRDKWKCPPSPSKLEAAEYWHFVLCGVAASAPFVLCERNTKHSTSRLPRRKCAPPKATEPHPIDNKRAADEVHDVGRSAKKQKTTSARPQDVSEEQIITIGTLLDHIENLPCRLHYALRRHVDVHCIPDNLVETVCQISASLRLMIKQNAPAVTLQRSHDESLARGSQDMDRSHGSVYNGRIVSGTRPDPQSSQTCTGLSTPTRSVPRAPSYHFHVLPDLPGQASGTDLGFTQPPLAQAGAPSLAPAWSDDNAAPDSFPEGLLEEDFNFDIFDCSGPGYGDALNHDWEDVEAGSGEMSQ